MEPLVRGPISPRLTGQKETNPFLPLTTPPPPEQSTCRPRTHEGPNRQFRGFRFHTVDGRNPAPPKKRWNDDSPVNINKQWICMVSKWCELDFVHPQYFSEASTCSRHPGAASWHETASCLKRNQKGHKAFGAWRILGKQLEHILRCPVAMGKKGTLLLVGCFKGGPSPQKRRNKGTTGQLSMASTSRYIPVASSLQIILLPGSNLQVVQCLMGETKWRTPKQRIMAALSGLGITSLLKKLHCVSFQSVWRNGIASQHACRLHFYPVKNRHSNARCSHSRSWQVVSHWRGQFVFRERTRVFTTLDWLGSGFPSTLC